MRFRKRPVEIEAWRWLFSDEQEKTPRWILDALGLWPQIGGASFEPDHRDGPRITLATLEGLMIARPGDWIIRGIEGEIYPCKPAIFEATYEPVEAQS